MPKLNHYLIRHVENATNCKQARIREVVSKMYPEKDVPNSTRKLTHEEYKDVCQAITDPAFLASFLSKVKSSPEKVPATTPEAELIQVTDDMSVDKSIQDLDNLMSEATSSGFISTVRFVEKHKLIFCEMVDHLRQVDTVLKPLIAEIDTIVNEGKETSNKTRGGIWAHIYSVMRNRYSIDFRSIIDNQGDNAEQTSAVQLLVSNRLSHIAIEVATNWLADIKRKMSLDQAVHNTHNPKPQESVSLGALLKQKANQ